MLVIEYIMTASLLLLKRQERMRSIQSFESATYEHVSRCCMHQFLSGRRLSATCSSDKICTKRNLVQFFSYPRPFLVIEPRFLFRQNSQLCHYSSLNQKYARM